MPSGSAHVVLRGSLRFGIGRGSPGSQSLLLHPAAERFVGWGMAHDLAAHRLDDPLAAVHHDVAGLIDRIDEIAVDEHARENPPAEQQDERPDHADVGVKHLRNPDAEGAAPAGRGAEAPAVAKGETEGQRPQDEDQQQREDRVVEQQRTLADDADADKHQYAGKQDAEDAERVVHQHAADARTGLAAEVLHLVAQQFALLGRTLQDALVHVPREKREEDRGGDEQTDEKQQQSRDPAGAVAVGAGHGLPPARRGGCIVSGCHVFP